MACSKFDHCVSHLCWKFFFSSSVKEKTALEVQHTNEQIWSQRSPLPAFCLNLNAKRCDRNQDPVVANEWDLFMAIFDPCFSVGRVACFSLREVELFGCFNLTAKTATGLANHCKGLVNLNVGQVWKLTDTCIAQLSGSLGLVETLNISGCKQVNDHTKFFGRARL